MNLGKLQKGELRDVWKNEAYDFTNWLAKEENLSLLSDEIGIGIKLIRTEANVGKFHVDILAEEENSERKIIIENQLEPSDHEHLGKIITYASGYDAYVVVWIVKDVRLEHKQAIDWLNEHTDENVNFIIVKMELWKIGDSPYAPKFHVIAEPNDWAKAIKKSTLETELTDTRLMQYEYWSQFNEYIMELKSSFKTRKPSPQHWYNISIGNSVCHICLTINTRDDRIGCEIYINNSNDLYHKFQANKNKIEEELNEELEWDELPAKKASRIKLYREINVNDRLTWDDCFKWMATQTERFKTVFTKYI